MKQTAAGRKPEEERFDEGEQAANLDGKMLQRDSAESGAPFYIYICP